MLVRCVVVLLRGSGVGEFDGCRLILVGLVDMVLEVVACEEVLVEPVVFVVAACLVGGGAGV